MLVIFKYLINFLLHSFQENVTVVRNIRLDCYKHMCTYKTCPYDNRAMVIVGLKLVVL